MTRWNPIFWLTVLGLMSGCESLSQPEWEIFGDIIESNAHELDDLSRCARLSSQSLRGECAMIVALSVSKREGLRPDALCKRVAAGTWRDECFFLAAERYRTLGKTKAAIRACRQTGPFRSSCALHLWQRAAATLTLRFGATRIAEMEPHALRMYDRWHARVGDFSDFETRFWIKIFRQLWSQPGLVDTTRCDVLSEAPQAACVEGAVLALDQALRGHLNRAEWTVAFCTVEPLPSGALAKLPGSDRLMARFVPHPALDRLTQKFHQHVCVEGTMPPPPRDPPPGPQEAIGKPPAPPP